MCGIAGIIGGNVEPDLLGRMGHSMEYRGPDARGIWVSDRQTEGFVHQRLSILDLSDLGKQPMMSPSGRYMITYNGEIYNFRQLRDELSQAGFEFSGGSDTEVLLAAVERWGIVDAVNKFVGMFAFAIWDNKNQSVTLVRDRLGIKPLYYCNLGGRFYFSSELPSLLAGLPLKPELNMEALALYFKYKYIPAPHSIYQDVQKVMPGTMIQFSQHDQSVKEVEYWSLIKVAEQGQSNFTAMGPEEYVDLLEDALEESVKLRMIADVPLGGFLSGGIDSSTIVALMQKNSTDRIKTYTIGFHDQKYNEAGKAKSVAEHLNTEHHEKYMSSGDMLDLVHKLPRILGEPMADISILPTLLLSEMTSRDVTVALSGDGGDELFCGYGNYDRAHKLYSGLEFVPQGIRSLLGGVGSSMFKGGGKLPRLASLIAAPSAEAFAQGFVSQWQNTSAILRHQDYVETSRPITQAHSILSDIRHYMMLKDAGGYMVDDILMKVDRASMAYSLEARVPILDHRVVELAWQMPLSTKYKDGVAKWPLRNILDRYLPKEIYDMPKQGFGVPVSSWLRSDLKPWAEGLIFSDHLKHNQYVKSETVEKLWFEHQSNKYDRGAYLWSVLHFLNWEAESSSWG